MTLPRSGLRVQIPSIALFLLKTFNNSEHLYFPDFYVKDLDLYIEVKGYETERDKVKWNTCKNKGIKLLVLKKNEIYQIKNNNFISIENFDIIK